MYRLIPIIIFALTSAVTASTEVYNDNVVIVLDASGSMGEGMRSGGGRRMDIAKQALKTVMQQIPETTNVGLLVFGYENGWAYPLGAKDNTKLGLAIDKIRYGGGTPLGKYIKNGADVLLKQRSQQHGYGSYRLLVVTDGEASDTRLVEKYTPEVVSRGITIDVIGVDMAGEHTLAKKAHSYRRADDPASLQKAIQEVFAEVNKDQGDMSDEFDIIAAITSEHAEAMINALTKSGNQPIGEVPPPQASFDWSNANPNSPPGMSGLKIFLIVGGGISAILVFCIIASELGWRW